MDIYGVSLMLINDHQGWWKKVTKTAKVQGVTLVLKNKRLSLPKLALATTSVLLADTVTFLKIVVSACFIDERPI